MPAKRIALVLAAVALAAYALYAVFGGRPKETADSREFTLAADKAYYVDNGHLGQLYVVEGTLTNNLHSARCRIQIKASLLDAKGQELARGVAEAGLTASISELKYLGWEELQAKLQPPAQSPCQATEVRSGASVGFMAVFRKPPPGAASYKLTATDAQIP
jgi:hypothetical protein